MMLLFVLPKGGFWGGGANETAHSQQMKAK